jgi:hypothetical protein
MTTAPRRETAGGFCFTTPRTGAPVVPGVKTGRSSGWSARYYLCRDDQVSLRIPNTLHAELAAGALKLPEFAGTRQKILEVFVGTERGKPVLLEARGSIYSFTSDGSLDLQSAAETLGSIVEGPRPRRVQADVIDIGPTVRHKRWVRDQSWQPTAKMLTTIRDDLTSIASDSKRVPTIKRQK